ncbi:unnamed protein product [Meganyctiphanes norvegica]|uniref:Cation/H+ exchanger transmembrane domain-containing protein n=1 Tax=Meganyctiphanes norvegica TaxID=48144 RepID=A0AAV2RQD2_MEGNR
MTGAEGSGFLGGKAPRRALPPDASFGEKIKYAVSWPPHGPVASLLTWVVVSAVTWACVYSILGDEALPGHNLFSIGVLFLACHAGGELVSKVRLPPLLGMLVVGIIIRSCPPGVTTTEQLNIGSDINMKWSAVLRKIALVVILIRAGLGLNPDALKAWKFMIIRLAFVPVLVECLTFFIVTHFLLGLPWLWSAMLGFLLSAVSPAVVVPSILHIQEHGYGVEKGIPTLVMAAASVDNVINISGFGILMGITFSKGSMLMQIFQGPIDVCIGLGFGLAVGVMCLFLPDRHSVWSGPLRFIVLLVCGILAVFGSTKIGFGGAGALGCLTMAFVAGCGWRAQGLSDAQNPVKGYFGTMWIFFQTLLFGLMGAQIDVSSLDRDTLLWGLICILIATTIRFVAAFYSSLGGGLNLKERIFVSIGRFPKATIQAAMGSVALDYALMLRNSIAPEDQDNAELIAQLDDNVILGTKVLTIAVLIIVMTAPLGSFSIMLTAPKLLVRKPPQAATENGGSEMTTKPPVDGTVPNEEV